MITQEHLHEMFEYKDGTLYRKKSLGRTKAGDKVGFINDKGYVAVNIGNQCIGVHRIVWMMQHGEMPSLIDHIDGNRQNNKICNLRLADRFGNAQNKRMHRNNTSGVKGVFWHSKVKKWKAQIYCNRKRHDLGFFENIKDAEEFIGLVRDVLHGQFANHGITSLTDRITALEAK